MTKRVDPTLIAQLARLPGDRGENLGTELVGRFAENLVTAFPRLRSLAASGDASTLALESHSLRGSAALLGAVTMAELARAIEADAHAGELARVSVTVDALEAEWNATEPELRAACVEAAAKALALRAARPTPPPTRLAD